MVGDGAVPEASDEPREVGGEVAGQAWDKPAESSAPEAAGGFWQPDGDGREKRARAWLHLVVPLAVVVLLVAVALYGTLRPKSYAERVQPILDEAAVHVSAIDEAAAKFTPQPESAKQLAPVFAEEAKALGATVAALKAIEPPEDAASYHEGLIGLHEDIAGYARQMSATAGYVNERQALLTEFSAALQRFESGLREVGAEGDLRAVVTRFEGETVAILGRLETLAEDKTLPISGRLLESNLATVSLALETIDTGLREKDAASVSAGVQRMQSAFAQDWSKALLEADASGVAGLTETLARIQRMRDSLMSRSGQQ